MLNNWKTPGVDPYGNDAREAVCSWVVENMDFLLGFVPQGHPRVLDEISSYNHIYLYAATFVAIFCSLGIIATAGFVYQWRLTKVFVYAQVTFVHIILFGFLLVCVGAILFSLVSTMRYCNEHTVAWINE